MLENYHILDDQILDERARYDAVCKRILAEKSILAWIMKSCLTEFRNCTISDIAEKYIEGTPEVSETPVAPDATNDSVPQIEGLSNEDTSLTEGTVTFDIRFHALAPSDGTPIQLIVNVEAQNDFYPGYPLLKRAIYYCSRLISSQYKTVFDQAHYGELRKVYSIWICMDPPTMRKNTVMRYHMVEEALVGKAPDRVENYDLLSVIMICLGGPEDENYGGVLKLLGTLFSTDISAVEKRSILRDAFDIPITQGLESEVSYMCNLGKGLAEKNIAKGRAQGRAEGHAEGMAEGRTKGRVEGMAEGRTKGRAEGMAERALSDLQNLMKNLGLSIEQAMNALSIPEAERETYIDLLKP